MRALILHQEIDKASAADDADVLIQTDQVAAALRQLGHAVEIFPVTLNLTALKTILEEQKPDFCFNLVESLDGSGQYLHFVPALLERLQIPFTGSGAQALYLSTDKILSKERLQGIGVATPAWALGIDPSLPMPCIIKPINEDASVDIDEEMVVFSQPELVARMQKTRAGRRYFCEQFITGREFNISIIAKAHGPQVLPPAEMLFLDYPPDKPQIVGYRAKWQNDSFEFKHTVRRFDYPPEDDNLLQQLTEISLECWSAFQLHGYARVDFRVDQKGRPWVLEINANPCISPDSGFIAATSRAGLSFEHVIQQIVADAIPRIL
ncbi:MAG: D-alanine--D-alanine ligase [Deltaproteobacteria bacterium]|nr:D-alanine--D-alanine ligase [Deltaproteobacteria bacterium]